MTGPWTLCPHTARRQDLSLSPLAGPNPLTAYLSSKPSPLTT